MFYLWHTNSTELILLSKLHESPMPLQAWGAHTTPDLDDNIPPEIALIYHETSNLLTPVQSGCYRRERVHWTI